MLHRLAHFLGILVCVSVSSLLVSNNTAEARGTKVRNIPRGDYGDSAPDHFFGPAAITISDANGPLLTVTSFGRCESTTVTCLNQDPTLIVVPPVSPNFIYFFQIRALRDINQPITLNFSAIFDVASVASGSDTSDYGIINDDQTLISQCSSLASGSPAQQACIDGFIDDTNTEISTAKTILALTAGLKQNDTLLLHIDSYLPPACLISSTNTNPPSNIGACVPNDFLTVSGATIPSQIVVVGPDPSTNLHGGPQTITSLSVATIPANSSDTTVTVTGTGFDSTSVLSWNGQSLTPDSSPSLTATQFDVTVPANLLTVAEVARVSVVNNEASGTTKSVPMGVVVQNNSIDTFTLSSTGTIQLGPTFQIALNPASSSPFLRDSLVELPTNGFQSCATNVNRPTLFLSGNQFLNGTRLVATLSSSDLAQPQPDLSVFALVQPAADATCPPSGTANTLISAPVTLASFGTQKVPMLGSAQSVTLVNTGSTAFNVSNITITGDNPSDFTMGAGGTCTPGLILNSGDVCTVSLAFAATHAGLRSAYVQLTDTTVSPVGTLSVFMLGVGSSPSPTLTSINPTSVIAGSGGFTLTLKGTNFTADSTVIIGGNAPLTPTSQTTTQLIVSVPSAYAATAGVVVVAVTNPQPDGGTSTPAVNLIVNNPAPTVASLVPQSMTAGGAAFLLTVNGTGFVADAMVNFGANPSLTPSSITSTQIQVTIPASDIATPGTPAVTVTDPAPGGGPSNSAAFSLTAPSSFAVNGAAATVTTTPSVAGTVATGTSTITVTPSGGFAGVVGFACGSLPGVTCAALTIPSGSTKGTLTVNVLDPSTSMTAMLPPAMQNLWATGTPQNRGGGKLWWRLSAGTGFATLFLLFVPGRKRYRAALGLGVICAVSFAIGCGGGSSGSGGGGGGGTTPIATTTQLMVSATKVVMNGSITVSATVTGGKPTGNVQFMVDGASLGNAVPIVSGTTGTITVMAVQAPAFLQLVGTHTLSARYLGDAGTQASSSGTLNITVNGTTNLTITGSSGNLSAVTNVMLTIQ